MAAAVRHVKSTYYTRQPVFKLVFEKSQSLMGGKLFSSLGRSANIDVFEKLFAAYIIWKVTSQKFIASSFAKTFQHILAF